jgi:hypothetical protein
MSKKCDFAAGCSKWAFSGGKCKDHQGGAPSTPAPRPVVAPPVQAAVAAAPAPASSQHQPAASAGGASAGGAHAYVACRRSCHPCPPNTRVHRNLHRSLTGPICVSCAIYRINRASHGVDEDVQHLLQFINTLGKTQEDGSVTVTFGELFADDGLQNTLEVS